MPRGEGRKGVCALRSQMGSPPERAQRAAKAARLGRARLQRPHLRAQPR